METQNNNKTLYNQENTQESEAYYPKNYFEGRKNFIEKAQKAGFTLYKENIQNSDNVDLSIDIAIMNQATAQNKLPALIHLCGTHGVEGYVGSGIQNGFLDEILNKKRELPKDVMIVLVHAVNPYGFHFNRRWNENNVDLNRNVLPEDIYPGRFQQLNKDTQSGSYKKFEDVFDLDHQWGFFDNVKFYMKAVYYILKVGFLTIKQAAVEGQYYDQKRIFYGGQELQPSIRFLINFLREKLQHTTKVIGIDVHSGLGPSGRDTLLASQSGHYANHLIFAQKNQKDLLDKEFFIDSGFLDAGKLDMTEEMKSYYNEQVNKEQKKSEAGAGYDSAQGLSSNYLEAWKIKKGIFFAQEFGTIGPISVLKGLIKENSIWQRRSQATQAALEDGGKTNKDSFFVESSFFKQNCYRRGIIVIDQAIAGLQDPQIEKYLPVFNQ